MRTRIIIECDVPADKTPEDVRQTVANIFNAADVYFPSSKHSYLQLLRAGGGIRKDSGNQIADYIEFLEFQLAQIHTMAGVRNDHRGEQRAFLLTELDRIADACLIPFEEQEWRRQSYRRRVIEAATKYVVHYNHPMREHHWDKLVEAVRLLRSLK